MRPTVATVLALPALKLRLVAGERSAESMVRWVAVSELGDPTPYLEGGEMLLTTGMQMATLPAEDLAEYVDRLADRGVVAVGVGIGISLDAAPRALIDAAQRRDLVLFEVPEATPFIAVSLAVSELLQADERDQTKRILTAQRELTRAALRVDAAAAILRQILRLTGDGALLLSSDGAVVEAAPASLAGRVDELAVELNRIRRSGRRGSGVLDSGSERWEVHSLGLTASLGGFLAVLMSERAGPAERAAIAVAISLLSLHVDRAAQSAAVERRMAQKALELLSGSGTAQAGRHIVDALGPAYALPATFSVMAIEGDTRAAELADELASDPTLRAAPCLVGVLGSSVVVLTAVDPDVQSALRRSDGQQLRLGVSRGVTLDDLQRGVAEAERALAAATVRDLRIARYDELAAEGLLGLVDERDALEFARSRLAPLRAYQESSGIDLVETLRAYLTANGQWDRAATELGVHRHTLRYRMRKVTQLLDVSVDTPQARMDLWFALSCVPAHNRTPPIL